MEKIEVDKSNPGPHFCATISIHQAQEASGITTGGSGGGEDDSLFSVKVKPAQVLILAQLVVQPARTRARELSRSHSRSLSRSLSRDLSQLSFAVQPMRWFRTKQKGRGYGGNNARRYWNIQLLCLKREGHSRNMVGFYNRGSC